MKVAVFVTVWALGISPAELKEHYLNKPLDMLKRNTSVESVEFYEPYPGDVPVMDDIPAPTGIVQINVASLDAARSLVSSEEFNELMKEPGDQSGSYEKVNMELFEAVHYPLPGHDQPPPRTAPLSFVVRYYGPVDNQAEFVDFYTKNHPPLLAKFPGIRNVLCYLPIGYGSVGAIENDAIVIGNEVVFDDLAALNAALDSDAMPAVMEDGSNFAPVGYNSHHAMLRKFIYQRGE